MEFRFDVNEVLKGPIVEIGSSLVPPGFKGDKRALWDTQSKISQIVNAMGEASAAAQGLSKPITTSERLRNSEHRLYLLIDQHANNGKGAVTGMLKTGEKGLYVFDRDGNHYKVTPPCVLDFYVHESRQRSGLGKRLFEHMLQNEGHDPVKMAIDRPSEKFLGFLNKHYQLREPVKQMNNYVVFDDFFPKHTEEIKSVEVDTSNTPVGKKSSANGLQPFTSSPYGRYGAPRPPCSMGQIIHNDTAVIRNGQEATGVKSEPATNCAGFQDVSPAPPNLTQSAPNVYYNYAQTNQQNQSDVQKMMSTVPQYSAGGENAIVQNDIYATNNNYHVQNQQGFIGTPQTQCYPVDNYAQPMQQQITQQHQPFDPNAQLQNQYFPQQQSVEQYVKDPLIPQDVDQFGRRIVSERPQFYRQQPVVQRSEQNYATQGHYENVGGNVVQTRSLPNQYFNYSQTQNYQQTPQIDYRQQSNVVNAPSNQRYDNRPTSGQNVMNQPIFVPSQQTFQSNNQQTVQMNNQPIPINLQRTPIPSTMHTNNQQIPVNYQSIPSNQPIMRTQSQPIPVDYQQTVNQTNQPTLQTDDQLANQIHNQPISSNYQQTPSQAMIQTNNQPIQHTMPGHNQPPILQTNSQAALQSNIHQNAVNYQQINNQPHQQPIQANSQAITPINNRKIPEKYKQIHNEPIMSQPTRNNQHIANQPTIQANNQQIPNQTSHNDNRQTLEAYNQPVPVTYQPIINQATMPNNNQHIANQPTMQANYQQIPNQNSQNDNQQTMEAYNQPVAFNYQPIINQATMPTNIAIQPTMQANYRQSQQLNQQSYNRTIPVNYGLNQPIGYSSVPTENQQPPPPVEQMSVSNQRMSSGDQPGNQQTAQLTAANTGGAHGENVSPQNVSSKTIQGINTFAGRLDIRREQARSSRHSALNVNKQHEEAR